MINLNIKFTNKGNTLIAAIFGELDHHTALYMRQKLDSELIRSTIKNLVMDFSNVSFMDSSGIGVIIGRYKNVKNLNGSLVITNISSHIKRILEMSGILSIIPIYENNDTAINNLWHKGEK